MFKIIQSHRTEYLVEQLLLAYKSKNQPIFEEFIVIVPSMVLGEWLDKSIASQVGISTLVTTTFWGQYQWTLMQKVLAEHNQWLERQDGGQQGSQEVLTVPEVAVLTGAVMQWRLFGYFTYYQAQIMADDKHPLYPLLTALLDEGSERSQQDIRLWSLASDFSRVFSRYLTHRDDWLTLWSQDKAVDVNELIAKKDELAQVFNNSESTTPEWLVAHYVELEAAQRHLWRLLFAAVYEHRSAIEARFWQIMAADSAASGVDIKSVLPSQLHIFTIQQLPQSELDFLQQLSLYCDITLLHYNPSQLFWADIVDKQWLQRQQVVNPESVFLRDYGHTLLSRLGKQSRETFAMLASLSGNEYADNFVLDWQDKFALQNEPQDNAPLSLLAHLQQDILMLDESATQSATAAKLSAALGKQLQQDLDDDNGLDIDSEKNSLSESNDNDLKVWYSDNKLEEKHYQQPRQWQISQYDNSLSIHSCHSLQRQLEILRNMIGKWLNEKPNRHLSDIVVLLPDVEQYNDLITSVFVNGSGQDGLTLPAKVTGVVDKSIRQLWDAISGFYTLLDSEAARFEAAVVLDWLMLPPLYESLGLTHEQMARGCDLLQQAGFIRGFDEAHLQQSLDKQDYDYRFSFSYALDQVTLGLLMPEADITGCLYPEHWQAGTLEEKTLPMSIVSLADAPIVEALCRIHSGLNQCRDDYKARFKAEEWLNRIENNVIHPYFGILDQTRPMRAIFNAMNGFKSSLRANRHYQRYHVQHPQYSQGHQGHNVDDPADHHSFTNTQVEAQLSRVNTLPLKLSFMLNSIEEELESQQVSAEPTGVITFGRFGALRNVPFELVVMLNMDLSEFPSRDRDNRYDLMKAGLARRGDRFSEDDDNGAFLDAMLCARDACWIFYNGQRLTDTHEHLPANPVSELLQFLQGEVQWQWEPLNNNQNDTALAAQIQHYLPKLIEQWLVTQHPALPFAEEVFIQPKISNVPIIQDNSDSKGQDMLSLLEQAMRREKLSQQRTQAPAKVWQHVFERLHEQQTGESSRQLFKVNLPSKANYAAIAQFIEFGADTNANSNMMNIDNIHGDIKVGVETQIDVQQLYYQVRHPAKHFLKEQRVHIVLPNEDTIYQEPLSLSGLGAYSINEQLLSEMHSHTDITDTTDTTIPKSNSLSNIKKIQYKKEIPAGSKRQSTIKNQHEIIENTYQDFKEQLKQIGIKIENSNESSLITACNEKLTSINIENQTQLQVKGSVPSETKKSTKTNLWLNISPSSARASHLLQFWLSHIYWQVARKTTTAQVAEQDGRSIWRFNKGSAEYKSSKNITTFALAPIAYDSALAELLKWVRFAYISSQVPIVMLPKYALNYLDSLQKAQDKNIVYQPKRSDFSSWLTADFNSDVIYDTCAQHELWRYVLQNHDAFAALTDALPTLAPLLFSAMNKALEPIG